MKSGGVAAEVKRVIVHDKFKLNLNDLALLELKVPLPVSSPLSNIRTIQIRKEDVPDKTKVNAYGWGSPAPLRAEELKKITTTTMSQKDCVKQTGVNSEQILCVDRILGNTPCSGDTGGGLYLPSTGTNQLIGIASTSSACGSRMPHIYARLSQYMKWINDHKK